MVLSMNLSFTQQLDLERARFAIAANGVVCAPAAGGIYWTALAALAPYVDAYAWCFVAFIGSGLIFPLALALQKPLRCNMMIKGNPLGGPGAYAFANMALCWAITIPAFHADPELVPLVLGIGMSLHLVGTAWSMNLKSYLIHPLLRAALVVALWYAFPEQRFLVVPIAVAGLYFLTIPAVLREVAAHRRAIPSARSSLPSSPSASSCGLPTCSENRLKDSSRP